MTWPHHDATGPHDGGDPGSLTEVEVRRNLSRLLDGHDLDRQRQALAIDLDVFALASLDTPTMNTAHRVADDVPITRLDPSLHSAPGRPDNGLLTFDTRQARAARQIGIEVVGA